MRLIRTAELALMDLGAHAFRSFLTALGVIFGVGAVVAMMAISEGQGRDALKAIEDLGIDNLEIRSVQPTRATQQQNNSRSTAVEFGVTVADIAHFTTVFENVGTVVPIRNARKTLRVAGDDTDVQVLATTPEFLRLSRSRLSDSRGRFLTDTDGDAASPVCVVGTQAARTLFGFEDPIGRRLTIGNGLFLVVGLLDNPAQAKMAGGLQLNNCVYIHLRAADSMFGKTARRQTAGGSENVRVEADYLYLNVKDVDRLMNTAARLRQYLSTTHPKADYAIVVPYELLKQKEAQVRRDKVLLASIASISLLVGGIGIRTIMMANIFERTKEIGTRRALGAKKRDLLLLFLAEAVALTTVGGVIGLGVGYGLTRLVVVTEFSPFEPVVTVFSIVLAMGVSVGLGILFGTYPAWKAANLDPIAALRSD
jgi:putative ABC transport system permease protein